MDETWIHHFTLELNWQSAEWAAAGESSPKRPKSQTSAGKVLASVFWDMQGILFIDYLKKGRIINSKYYIALLEHLKEEITKKWPQRKKKRLFHQDNVPCDKLIATMATTALWNCFHTHPMLQIWPPVTTGGIQTLILQVKRFGTSEDVISETEAYFEANYKSFYKKGSESVYHPRRRLCWWIKLNFT